MRDFYHGDDQQAQGMDLEDQLKVRRLKAHAKKVKKRHGLLHSEALDIVARHYAFDNWALLMQTAVEFGLPAVYPLEDHHDYEVTP